MRDLMEEDPDPSLYISDELARTFNTTADVYDDGCAGALGTNPRQLYLVGTVDKPGHEASRRVYDGDGASATLCQRSDQSGWYTGGGDVGMTHVGDIEGLRYHSTKRVWSADGASGTVTTKTHWMGWYM